MNNNTVLVIIELRAGKLSPVSLEAIVAAEASTGFRGGSIEAVVIGSDCRDIAVQIADRGISKVYLISDPSLEPFTADGYVAALKQLIEARKPGLIILPNSYRTRDFAPKLAIATGSSLTADVVGLKIENGQMRAVRQMFQGKLNADISFSGTGPWMISIQSGSFRADNFKGGVSGVVEAFPVQIDPSTVRTKPEDPFREGKQTVDLSKAEIIVAVGRGIKEEKNLAIVRELADVLGGQIAATRPVCDSGWLPIEFQVGSSGQTVAPKVYIALGISGAIQHTAGMKGARSVVAINKDGEAPIFDIADLAVTGNLLDIVPPLIEEIKKAKGLDAPSAEAKSGSL
jgi:electron transfer flavoprotein alpha subunit